MTLRAGVLTAAALACFAGNSLLCRPALAGGSIDAATFTLLRLLSGALVLSVLARSRPADPRSARAKWTSAAALFAYAAPFSFAYLGLGAATGALILFASVQATMIGWSAWQGDRPRALAWAGIALALGGLVLLTVPGGSAPPPAGALVMALAGAAWGVYSLLGRVATADPVAMTASSFLRATPLAVPVVVFVAATSGVAITPRGIVLACASGALASGLGYSIWYAALRELSTVRAAALQLLVPVLSACGAVVFLGESVSSRLVAASAAILAGVGATIWSKTAARRG